MRIIEWSSEVCSSDLTQFANAGGWLVSDRAKQQRQLRVVERRRSNQQLEHDGTERIQVAGRTERFACDVLGRHVQRRAEDRKSRRVGKECVSTCRSRWSPYH